MYLRVSVSKYHNASINFVCLSCTYNVHTKEELATHVEQEHIAHNETLQTNENNFVWVLENEDITSKFNEYHSQSLEVAHHGCLETHFNEILSLSGILVLQQRCEYGSLPSNIFPPKLLMFANVNRVLNQYAKGEIEDDIAKIQSLELNANLNEDERQAIRAIIGLIPYLYDCNMRPISKVHLSSSYVHPFVHGLFSSKQPSKVAHCSNLVEELENRYNKRPDYKVDMYRSYEYQYTNVYDEIKASKDIETGHLDLDFHHVVTFCKNSIDKSSLDTSIGFQVAGKSSSSSSL
ncbi:hypothetical protein G6F44_000566 [Rhizopus delemar]|nr:hypothetical protein G6F44_000566 [Rhizopus delemar]